MTKKKKKIKTEAKPNSTNYYMIDLVHFGITVIPKLNLRIKTTKQTQKITAYQPGT